MNKPRWSLWDTIGVMAIGLYYVFMLFSLTWLLAVAGCPFWINLSLSLFFWAWAIEIFRRSIKKARDITKGVSL